MNTIIRLSGIAILFFCHSCFLFKEKEPKISPIPSNQIITITVTDKNQNPIKGARVTVEPNIIKNVETDENGKCNTIPVGIGINFEITVVAEGYKNSKETVSVSSANAGNPTLITIRLDKESPLSFSPKSQLIFDAKNVNQAIDITNSGVLGDIQFEYIAPSAQWVSSLNPKESLLIGANETKRISINIDPKGLAIGEYKTKLNYNLVSKKNSNYKDNGEYEIIMNVTTPPATLKPLISNFSPTTAKYGSTITINGQNFETDTSKISVFFNDKKAKFASQPSRTQLRVQVPIGAKSGKIKVKVGGEDDLSNSDFEYQFTCGLSEVASLSPKMYINDITVGSNGSIFLCGAEFSSNTITSNAIIELAKNGSGYLPERTLIGGSTGVSDGTIGVNSSGKMVYPTKLFFHESSLYFTDNFDPSNHKASGVNEGFAKLRRISGNDLKTLYSLPLKKDEYIQDLVPLNINGFNGILFMNNNFYKYDYSNGAATKVGDFDGLNVFLDKDSKSIYLLELDPTNAPTRWRVKKKEVLNNNQISSGSSVVGAANLGKTSGQYFPKGMLIDTENNLAFVIDNNSNENYNVYQIKLDTKETLLVHNGKKESGFEDGILGEGGSFYSISCMTYDAVNKRILFVDVYRNNTIRAMTCQ